MPPKDPPANNHLLALGTAAVLAVFGAGFVRTQQAAERIEGASRRRHAPAPVAAPNNSADVSTPAPTPPAVIAPAAPESNLVETPKTSTTTRVANAKAEHSVTSTPAQPTKPKVEQKLDTAKATVVAEVATATPKPAPVAAETTSTKTSVPTTAATDSASVARDLKDGVYTGWGFSRHGNIESRVEIRNGRIISASVAQCLTMYSVYWIAALPPQVVKRQSPEVDVISGATESSNAFYDGVVEALKKAK